MKKYLFILLLIVAAVLVVSCVPKGGSADTASSEEAELLGEEESSALAGQAIARGCKTKRVDSCTSNDDGSITVKLREKTKQYGAKCSGRYAVTYRCREGGKPGYEYCRTQCEEGEACQQGNCVVLCGNGVVDAGETCSSCARDVVCGEGQQCWDGGCIAACSDSDPENNKSVVGIVRNARNGVRGLINNISDMCDMVERVGSLMQFGCSPNGFITQIPSREDCDVGQVCQDGACVAAEPVN